MSSHSDPELGKPITDSAATESLTNPIPNPLDHLHTADNSLSQHSSRRASASVSKNASASDLYADADDSDSSCSSPQQQGEADPDLGEPSTPGSPSVHRPETDDDDNDDDNEEEDEYSPPPPTDSPATSQSSSATPISNNTSPERGNSGGGGGSGVSEQELQKLQQQYRQRPRSETTLSADELRHLHGDDDDDEDGEKQDQKNQQKQQQISNSNAESLTVSEVDAAEEPIDPQTVDSPVPDKKKKKINSHSAAVADPMNSAPSAVVVVQQLSSQLSSSSSAEAERRRAMSVSESNSTSTSTSAPSTKGSTLPPPTTNNSSSSSQPPSVSPKSTAAASTVPINLLDEPIPQLDDDDDDILLDDSTDDDADDEDNFSLGSSIDDDDKLSNISSPPSSTTARQSVATVSSRKPQSPKQQQHQTHFFVATIPEEDALEDGTSAAASTNSSNKNAATKSAASPTTPKKPQHHRKRSSGGGSVFGFINDSPDKESPDNNNNKSSTQLTQQQEEELLFGSSSDEGSARGVPPPPPLDGTRNGRADSDIVVQEEQERDDAATTSAKNVSSGSSSAATTKQQQQQQRPDHDHHHHHDDDDTSGSDDSLDDLVQRVKASKPQQQSSSSSSRRKQARLEQEEKDNNEKKRKNEKNPATTTTAATAKTSPVVAAAMHANPTGSLKLTLDIPRSPFLRPESVSPPSSAISGPLHPPQQNRGPRGAQLGVPCVFRLKRRVAIVGYEYMVAENNRLTRAENDEDDDDDDLLGMTVKKGDGSGRSLLSSVVRFPSLLQFSEDALPSNFFNPRIAAILADEGLDTDIATPLAGPVGLDFNDDDFDEFSGDSEDTKQGKRRALEELHLEELSIEQQMTDAQAVLDEEEAAAMAEAAAQLPSVTQRVQRLRETIGECSEAWQEAAPVSPRSAPLMLKRESKNHSLRVETRRRTSLTAAPAAAAIAAAVAAGARDTNSSFGKSSDGGESASSRPAAANENDGEEEVIHESGSDDDDVNQVGPEHTVWSPLYRRPINIGLPSRESSVVEILKLNDCKTPRDLGRKLQTMLMDGYDTDNNMFAWSGGGGSSSPSPAKRAFVELAHSVVTVAKNAYLRHQPLFRTVNPPVTVLGDIHGSFGDALYFVRSLFPFGGDVQLSPSGLVCLGDYVDRGAHSLEVFLLMLSLFVQAPTRVVLLRGNHECRAVCSDRNIYGQFSFLNSCVTQLGDVGGKTMFRRVTRAFRHLPLCAEIVGGVGMVEQHQQQQHSHSAGGGGGWGMFVPGSTPTDSMAPPFSRSPSAQPPRSRGGSFTGPAGLVQTAAATQNLLSQQPKILCVHGGFPRFGLKQQHASTAALGDEKQRQSRTRAQARIEARKHFERLRNPEFPRFLSLFPQGLPYINRTLRSSIGNLDDDDDDDDEEVEEENHNNENDDNDNEEVDKNKSKSKKKKKKNTEDSFGTPRRGFGVVASDGSYSYDFSSDSDEDLQNQLLCPAPDPRVQEDLLCAFDLLWSDPTLADDQQQQHQPGSMAGFGAPVNSNKNPLFKPNSRGDNVMSFTEASAEIFLQATGYSTVVRGHQEKLHGYRVSQRGRVITLFSSSNYCGHATSAGCLMVHGDGGMQLVSRPYARKPAAPLRDNKKK